MIALLVHEVDGNRADALQIESIHQVNIQVAIVVIVEKGPARSGRFYQEVLSGSAIGMGKGNPGLCRDIRELHCLRA